MADLDDVETLSFSEPIVITYSSGLIVLGLFIFMGSLTMMDSIDLF